MNPPLNPGMNHFATPLLRFVFSLVFVFALRIPAFAEQPASVAPLLQPFVEKHELAGVVALVTDKDKVLAIESVGFADIAAGKAMKADSIFWIASQSKPITAIAVMMLVDDRKISLDDPVEKYLPEFRGQMVVAEKDADHVLLRKPSHPITVREVLSHMSGMPFQSAVENPTLDGLSLAAAVRSYAITPLQTEPGTQYKYSNAGINTAARIIEVVSGMKYEDFMQTRLFDPLGMKETTFWPNDEQVARVAKSYRPDKAKSGLEEFQIGQLIYPLTDRAHRFPMPAGGLFSTAHDTAIFCRMLLNGGELNGHRYISESSLKELTMRQTPSTVKDSYGLGFSVGNDSFGHGGAHATNMEIRPGKGLAIVWMVQHGGFPGEGGKAQGVFKNWAFERFAPKVGPATGSLVVHGGGRLDRETINEIVKLAGGPDSLFVIIPTAEAGDPSASALADKSFLKRAGVKNITVLHTRNRDTANSEAFCEPLTKARGVWLGGGRQWRFADAYLGTRVVTELNGVLARGGVIAGSSAGATIQGSYMVRGAPEGNHIMMAKGHEEGFAFLKDVAIDQHVIARKREEDLLPVIDAHPALLGLGLDEGTAIVVQGDRARVVGASKLVVYDRAYSPGTDGKRYFFLNTGEVLDLATRRKAVTP